MKKLLTAWMLIFGTFATGCDTDEKVEDTGDTDEEDDDPGCGVLRCGDTGLAYHAFDDGDDLWGWYEPGDVDVSASKAFPAKLWAQQQPTP